jgi:hypothetical protein
MNYSDKESIYAYFREAIKQIPKDHPHYHEIRQLLIKQVNEDLHDHESYATADRRAS